MAPQLKKIKNNFFKKEKKTDSSFNFKTDDFSLNELDAEFSSLYQLFISNKKKWENDRNNDAVEYMAELCDLMIAYYQIYYVREKLDDLQSKKKEQGSRYLVKDFGTSKSPKSTRQRAKYFGRDCPASGTLR